MFRKNQPELSQYLLSNPPVRCHSSSWWTRDERRETGVSSHTFSLPGSRVEIPSSRRKQETWPVSVPSPQSRLSARSFSFWYMDVLRLGSLLSFPAVVWLSQEGSQNGSEAGRERDAELGEGESLFSWHHLYLSRDPYGVCRGPPLQSLGSVAAHCLGKGWATFL